MQVIAIDAPSAAPAAFQPFLAEMIGAIGRPNFGETMLAATRAATGCQQIIAFAGKNGKAPRTILFESTGEVSRRMNEKYLSSYWKVDPVRLIDEDAPFAPAYLAAVDAHGLSSRSYRDDCFTKRKLRSRAATCRIRDGLMVRLNVYFKDRRAFDPAVNEYLVATSELIDVLLRRHDTESERGLQRLDQKDIAERLAVAAPELSGRELQVCTHIARGLTSEGIALELGISVNTVLTYRKRAYTRLNITTQNELLHLIVH